MNVLIHVTNFLMTFIRTVTANCARFSISTLVLYVSLFEPIGKRKRLFLCDYCNDVMTFTARV